MKKWMVIAAVLLIAVIVYCWVTGKFMRPNPLPAQTLATYVVPKITDRSPTAQAQAANDFLALLDEETKSGVVFPLDSPERKKWTNYPPQRDETVSYTHLTLPTILRV